MGPPGDFADLRRLLSGYDDLRLAILFGSLATGRAGPESDLDLAVRFDRPLTAERKQALIERLAEATGRPVDLVDLHTVGEPFLGQILQKGVRLAGSDTEYGNLLARHLFDEADFMPYYRRILETRRKAWIGE